MSTRPFSNDFQPLVDYKKEHAGQTEFDPVIELFWGNDGNDEEISKPYAEISTWRVFVNILNTMEGVGFLALPYAVFLGGITILIGIVVWAVIMAYTAYLLAECLDEEDQFGERKRVRWTYQDIGMDCWPPFKHIVRIVVSISIFTNAGSFVILCGATMSQLFPHVPITESQWACIGTALVFPTVFLDKLSDIAWISSLSAIALTVSAGIALNYEFREVAHWDFHSLLFWDTRGVFVGLSIIALSFSIHNSSVPMAAEVSKPSKFKMALVWCFTFGTIFKMVFACSGFLTYTSATKQVLLNNLPSGIVVQIIGTLFVINALLTYPIYVFVLVKYIEELTIYEKLSHKIPSRVLFLIIRFVIVLAILVFAVGIPHFALASAFAGCFVYCVALVFPGLFHLRLKYRQLSKLKVLIDVALVILGAICMIFGLVSTIISLDAKM